ncbi:MAG: hypothetical protein IJD45_05505 [Clostridia bacterium]|nr:hypothetical protein [Clostridia bacterium]
MKYCSKCGKELLDEAVICVGCGCAVENKEIKNKQKTSIFEKNKKQWMIVFSILFVVFAGVSILLLTSRGFDYAVDWYQYLNSDLGQLGKNLSTSGAIEWQQKVDAAKDALIPYYIGIGASGVLALAALIGDVLLFVNKKKVK